MNIQHTVLIRKFLFQYYGYVSILTSGIRLFALMYITYLHISFALYIVSIQSVVIVVIVVVVE
jgi:hypothetical protein